MIDAIKYVQAADTQGTTWDTPLVLDSEGQSIGMFSPLVIIDGLPAIGYVKNEPGVPELRYIRALNAVGTNWTGPVVAIQIERVGIYPWLSKNEADISYWDNVIGGLKYAHLQAEQYTVYLPLVIK